MPPLFEIIHENLDLLVLHKPAGLVCHPTKGDAYSSLISRVRLHLGPSSSPHLINRLDRETSGVSVVAKHNDAARQLRRIWENRHVHKEYTAIVHGHLSAPDGMIDAPLGKDLASAVAIKDCVRPDGAPAQTAFHLIRAFERGGHPFSLLRVNPITGRKHQIRIHLAYSGHPIVGDKIYGPDEHIYLDFVLGRLAASQSAQLLLPHHALHAQSVEFPWSQSLLRFSTPPEPWFTDFLPAHTSALP